MFSQDKKENPAASITLTLGKWVATHQERGNIPNEIFFSYSQKEYQCKNVLKNKKIPLH